MAIVIMSSIRNSKKGYVVARKSRKDEALLKARIRGSWMLPAFMGVLVTLSALIIPTVVTNKYLVVIISQLQPLWPFVAGFFLLIALYKFISADSNKVDASDIFSRNEPTISSNTPVRADHPKEWSLKLLQTLEWKLFEDVCVAIFNERGMKAVSTDLGADGGIDIKLYQEGSTEPSAIAQCKSWKSKVGVKAIREFIGVMSHEKVSKGYYLTPSGFTDEAKEIAKPNGLILFSGDMILTMIKRLPKESQDKLLALVYLKDYTIPSCVKCGTKMIRRQVKSGNKPDFWGCASFPKCRQTLKLRAIDK